MRRELQPWPCAYLCATTPTCSGRLGGCRFPHQHHGESAGQNMERAACPGRSSNNVGAPIRFISLIDGLGIASKWTGRLRPVLAEDPCLLTMGFLEYRNQRRNDPQLRKTFEVPRATPSRRSRPKAIAELFCQILETSGPRRSPDRHRGKAIRSCYSIAEQDTSKRSSPASPHASRRIRRSRLDAPQTICTRS